MFVSIYVATCAVTTITEEKWPESLQNSHVGFLSLRAQTSLKTSLVDEDGGRSKKNGMCHFFQNAVTPEIIVGIAPYLAYDRIVPKPKPSQLGPSHFLCKRGIRPARTEQFLV